MPFVFIFNPELLLVGITSFWHAILIFCVSLIAILCFTAATQGWLLTRLKITEIAGLLFVTFSLFRPDLVVGILSPEYTRIEIDKKHHAVLPKAESLRIHVTRNTAYGDRYKLFKFSVESKEINNLPNLLGFAVRQDGDRYFIDELKFDGIAKKQGIEFNDELTGLEVNNPDRLNKHWGYLFGFLLLIIIFLNQRRRMLTDPSPRVIKSN